MLPLETDVRDPDAVAAMVRQTLTRFNASHRAVNNAEIADLHDALIKHLSVPDWNDAIVTDLNDVFLSLKFVVPAIVDSGGDPDREHILSQRSSDRSLYRCQARRRRLGAINGFRVR